MTDNGTEQTFTVHEVYTTGRTDEIETLPMFKAFFEKHKQEEAKEHVEKQQDSFGEVTKQLNMEGPLQNCQIFGSQTSQVSSVDINA